MYDAIVIGAGTAGLTAGIYLARRGANALVLEGNTYGGQIINSREVENYPGIKSISGFEFATELYEQVTSLGGEIEFGEAERIEIHEEYKTVVTSDNKFDCKNVIIAVGAKNRSLGVEGEDDLIGLGVSYCATCDGGFFKEKDVAVVGGGNTALDDALFLSEICNTVYLIHRRDEFRGDSMAVAELKDKPNVKFVLNSTVSKLITGDDGKLSAIKVKSKVDNSDKTLNINGIFVAVGQTPNTAFVKDLIELDENGYIKSGEDCKTNIDGIYAIGDCRTKALRQLTTAAADGSIAATAIKF